MQVHIDKDFEKFISGFVAGEGSFYVGFNNKFFSPIFQIHLHKEDSKILIKIKSYLRCGNITFSDYKNRKTVTYRVSKAKDLKEIIIPFFERNYLYDTSKQKSFDRWRIITEMIWSKEHKTKEGQELISLLIKKINRNHNNRKKQGDIKWQQHQQH